MIFDGQIAFIEYRHRPVVRNMTYPKISGHTTCGGLIKLHQNIFPFDNNKPLFLFNNAPAAKFVLKLLNAL
uniref:Uncharacterized protein n=1 Tax=Pinctada fucata TaxID=50426 RepID=A0A194APS6_PINFU